MLTHVLAHAGAALRPHDVWSAWAVEPVVLAGLVAGWWLYRRGARHRRRARAFQAGLAVLAVAVLSPVDAMAGVLASAHMVQHLFLVLVAAPLLAASRPLETMWRGVPVQVRRWAGRVRRVTGLTPAAVHRVPLPGLAWLAHVGAVWFWHAAGPYQAALRSDALHGLQHGLFLVTGVAFWHVALVVLDRGAAVGYVFTAALQSTLLAALLTFATSAWYPAYAATTPAWGSSPLADQQLAGVLMWVPGGLAYLAAGLGLVTAWLRDLEADDAQPAGSGASRRSSRSPAAS